MAITKLTSAQRRKFRTRNKLERINRSGLPRLSVHRTGRQIYAQVILGDRTLAASSTLDPEVRAEIGGKGGAAQAAEIVGRSVAGKALQAGVTKVLFDRGAYLYHGRVKALADGARQGGLLF